MNLTDKVDMDLVLGTFHDILCLTPNLERKAAVDTLGLLGPLVSVIVALTYTAWRDEFSVRMQGIAFREKLMTPVSNRKDEAIRRIWAGLAKSIEGMTYEEVIQIYREVCGSTPPNISF